MDFKDIILFCFLLTVSFKLIKGAGWTIEPAGSTPPVIQIPRLENCTKYSTLKDNWVTYTYKGVASTYCYLFPTVATFFGSWHEANDDCRKRNATLLSIQDSITNQILSFPVTSGNVSSGHYWIGLNSLNGKRGQYKWIDGSPRPYTNYANTSSNGDPLPNDVRDQGRCVSIRVITQNYPNWRHIKKIGQWFKDDCNVNHQYICQKSSAPLPTLQPLPTGGCPTDWFNANQKCIKYMNQSQTFEQARTQCEQYFMGEVLTIHSQQEQDFITIMTAGLKPPYIGIYYEEAYVIWTWTDQSRVTYTNFGVQPATSKYLNKNCVVVDTNSTQPGKWLLVNCNDTHPVICQVDKDSTDHSGTNFLAKKCNLKGFEKFIGFRNSCYSVADSDPNKFSSFATAEQNCQSLGSHLLSIVDPFEEIFIKYYLSQNGKSDKYWIGFQSKINAVANVSQVFEWTDDWPSYYTNWDSNEPLYPGLPHEECVYMVKSNGTWRTTSCDSNFAYICKITNNSLPKLNIDKTGVCPQLNGVTDKSLAWVDQDRRSQYCYWFSYGKKTGYYLGLQTWTDASFHCRRRNGTLVSIHSNHELRLLGSKMSQMGTNSYNTWTGLSKEPNGKFVWEDGSALDYTNWDPDEIVSESSDLNDGSSHQCVEFKTLDLMWRQQSCSGKLNYYICATKKIYRNSGLSIGPTIGFGIIVAVIVAMVR